MVASEGSMFNFFFTVSPPLILILGLRDNSDFATNYLLSIVKFANYAVSISDQD